MISLSVDLFSSTVMGTLWAFSRKPWLSVLGYFLEFINDLMISLFLFSLCSLYESPVIWMLDLLDWPSNFLIFFSYILFLHCFVLFSGRFPNYPQNFLSTFSKKFFLLSRFLISVSLFVIECSVCITYYSCLYLFVYNLHFLFCLLVFLTFS